MSTPEQPATPALTRKQLRDIRNTGATPIISTDVPRVEDAPVSDAPPAAPEPVEEPVEVAEAVEAPEAVEPPPPHVAPLPRAAVPAVVHDLPGADASVDLGVSPLTRRQARQQERIRTASVPVITPEVAAAHAASVAAAASAAQQTADETPSGELSLAQLFGTEAAATVAQDDAPADDHDTVIEATVVEEESTRGADHAEQPTEADVAESDAEHPADTDARRTAPTPTTKPPVRPNTRVRLPQKKSAPSSTRSSARSCSPVTSIRSSFPHPSTS